MAQTTPMSAGGYQVRALAGLGPEPNIAVSPSGQKIMVGRGAGSPSTFFLSTDRGNSCGFSTPRWNDAPPGPFNAILTFDQK